MAIRGDTCGKRRHENDVNTSEKKMSLPIFCALFNPCGDTKGEGITLCTELSRLTTFIGVVFHDAHESALLSEFYFEKLHSERFLALFNIRFIRFIIFR